MTYTSINSVIPRGQTVLIALAAFAVAVPALAQPETKGVCLYANEIRNTQVLNNHQILFYMRGNKVWLNTLQSPCSTLPVEEGFSMLSDFSQFCANAQAIRVVKTGQVCMLGEFTPYKQTVGRS